MAAAKRKSIAKLCLALGLFVLAGFFRQADRVGAPLPSAAFFLLTNLIYIGLAMGQCHLVNPPTSYAGRRIA